MEQWHERRPLPSRRDIGAAEIVDHVDARQLGQQRTIADLPGPSALRFVQNRLTVEADHVHIARCDAATLQEIADGLCVALGQLPLDAGDLAAAAENGPEAVVER